jgi:PAS domain S-box-containing protein
MVAPHTYSRFLRGRFHRSLVIIVATIGFAEATVMGMLDLLDSMGLELTAPQEAIADGALLSVICFPIIWSLSLRPLVEEVLAAAEKAEALGRSNAELREALDSHALVAITNQAGLIIQANDRLCETSGYTRGELLGNTHKLLDSGMHDEMFFNQLKATVRSGRMWHGEICNRSKDGSLYWVHSTVVPMLNASGQPIQYITIDRDITTQKRTEAKLQALYRAVEASSDMVIITQANGSIQYANPALSAYTGWPIDSLIGKTPAVLQSKKADVATLRDLKESLRRGKSWSGRLLLRRLGMPQAPSEFQTSDPLEYWANISVTPIRDAESRISGYVQIQRDATRQVAAETELLREQEASATRLAVAESLQRALPVKQRFEHTLELLAQSPSLNVLPGSGVYLRSSDGGQVGWEPLAFYRADTADGLDHQPNQQWLDETSWGAEDMVVEDHCAWLGATSMQPHGHYLVPLMANGENLGLLVILTDPQPSRLASQMSLLPRVAAKMALALLQDRAHASLERARDTALQATLTKSRFLANMSHEIRTPMNGVLGMLELLRDTHLTAAQWDLVETAYASADCLLEIIDDVLDFSKLEAGRIELEEISFDLPATVEDVCHLLARRAHAKKLDLNCLIPPGFRRHWRGDPTRIRQILVNLVGNAIKFTEHGEVTVRLGEQGSFHGTSCIVLEVIDTGIGIPPEVYPLLFQPFAQADSSTARRFGGTGLGLSICKELVSRMRGTLEVDTQPGQGSRFWFALPLLPADEALEPALPDVTEVQGKRILIVDASGTHRQITRHHLESWGMTVSEADNTEQALNLLESSEAPDLIVADSCAYQPLAADAGKGRSGSPHWREIPVLALNSGAQGPKPEFCGYRTIQTLMKPVRQNQLFDAVLTGLGVSGSDQSRRVGMQQNLPNYSGRRALVAEDNRVNQKVISSMLAKFQLQMDMVENGLMATQNASRQHYDLILMDCQMPVMDGYEATRSIRQQEALQGLPRRPIIAVTAHSLEEERLQCIEAGMDGYLTKPISMERLASVLQQWLEGDNDEDKGIMTVDTSRSLPQPDASAQEVWNHDEALSQLGGDEQLLMDMIALYRETAPEQLDALRVAWRDLDYDQLRRAAHSLKGLAGHFRADACRGLAARLEQSAGDRNQAECENLVEQVETAVHALTAALTSYRERFIHV